MKWHRLAPVCGALLLAAISFGCNKLKARDQLNKGVASYRNAQFQQAIKHFQQAENYDPTLLMAKLYLATAYSNLYIPGGDSAENIQVGKDAIRAFEDVLKDDPNNTTALASIGQIYYNMHQFEKAKELHLKRLQIEPDNPEAYYWVGQLDWDICYPRRMQLRKDLNLATPNKDGDLPPLPEKARAELAEKNGQLVDEGLKYLEKAVEMSPDNVGAVSYLNLTYREKADIEADPSARDEDLKKANDLNARALGIKKQQEEKASSKQK